MSASPHRARGPGTPPAEVAIGEPLVRALLAAQHPDLAGRSLAPVDEGWDNVMFRLGPGHAVRLPRRALAAPLLEREQAWLPVLAPRLPVAVPSPVRAGVPGEGYPWRWSVLPWIEGRTADADPPVDGEAASLAAFLRALHAAPPPEAPRNPVRGVALALRRTMVEERRARLARVSPLVTPELDRLWHDALEAPMDSPDTWIHGDLHARNVLVSAGRISGVIDWSDMAAGDRATDLAAAWGLFASRRSREAFVASLPEVSDATWRRARGWAFAFGVMLLDSGLADHPRHAVMGERTLKALAEGP